jgi:hypothetical protein
VSLNALDLGWKDVTSRSKAKGKAKATEQLDVEMDADAIQMKKDESKVNLPFKVRVSAFSHATLRNAAENCSTSSLRV